MSDPTPTSGESPPSLPASLAALLDRIRGRHLAVDMAGFPVWLLAGLSIAWTVQGGLDRWLNLSWPTRCALLALDALGASWLLIRHVVRPWLKRLDREGAALLVERKVPEFRSALISAVEFASPQSDAPPQSAALVRHLIEDVAEKAKASGLVERVVNTAKLRTALKWMAAPLLVALAAFLAYQPISLLVVKRILLSNEAFPPDTRAFALSGDVEIDEGGDVALSAKAEGLVPPEGKLVITHEDGRTESLVVRVSPNADFTQVVKNVRGPFHYRFELNDDVSPEHTVKVNYPPSVKELRFVQTYPPYTKLPETLMPAGGLKLLEGSTLRVEGSASKEIRSATVTVKGGDVTDLAIADPEKTAFRHTVVVPGAGWKSLSFHLVGREGDGSVQDPVYPVELVRDRPPSVSMTKPEKDTITAVMNATIPVEYQAMDDFALNYVALHYRVMRGESTNNNDAPTSSGRIPAEIPNGAAEIKRKIQWELGRILPAPAAGDSIVFWIEAVDNNGVAGPVTSRSTEHTILIVTEEQKRQELLEQIARKAEDIERLYEQQRAINVRTENSIR